MKFVHLKIVFILNGWLFAKGSPVAVLQATSSQSIVFHQSQATSSARPITTSSSVDQYGENRPKYEYKYEVSDHETGDRKSHWESRDGDNVRGVYTLYEPDGALRTVEYTADALHGFNAVVSRNEPSKHQQSRGSGHKNLASNNAQSYKQPSDGHMSDRSLLSSASHSNELGRSVKPSYNQGVDFSVVHGVRKFGESQDKLY